MQGEQEELQLSKDDEFPEEDPAPENEDREGETKADDMVTLPPESEPEGEDFDGIGDGLLKRPPRGRPRVDYSDAGKKQGTSLDPDAGARLQPTSDAREGRKFSFNGVIY